MCSNPNEIPDKTTGQIHTVACRACDECIATRRHGWVARAMAEKTDHTHCLCIALTYSEETQESRDGASMFCYADVRAFLKRLRSAAARRFKTDGQNFKPVIRFLCAGEQGDRNGRCHWHLILYSNFDLTTLGLVYLRSCLTSDRSDMISVGKRKIRLNWSLWPMGFVTFQQPDQGGMNYVLSYCLKDQFTVEKSRNTLREAKSENFATGLFRMSKRPAIGEAFFVRKMEALESSGSVLPALKISIPGFKGYYQPNGTSRKKLLWYLVALNQRVVWATGANAPQWSSLLASCKDIAGDMEILNGLPQIQIQRQQDEQKIGSLDLRAREGAQRAAFFDFSRTCARSLPCQSCLHQLTDKTILSLGLCRSIAESGEYQYLTPSGSDPSNPYVGSVNRYCIKRGSKIARLAAPVSGVDQALEG